MRFQIAFITLIALTGCSKSRTNHNPLDQERTLVSVDSILLTRDKYDTLSYIGYIQKFADNNLFYTDLYFVDDFNYDDYNAIVQMGEEVVYEDEELKRTRFEIEKVGQYFDLTGFETITIYNANNQMLTTGYLGHLEYIEDMIENSFVAVFEVEEPNITGYQFCVGNSNEVLVEIDFSPFDDERLESSLIDFLAVIPDRIWGMHHYRFNDHEIYSTVSADTTAYIVETKDNMHTTLYQSSSSEVIDRLTVISKKIEGREILLVNCGVPETDMMWSSLLIFNGATYELSRSHRILNK